MPGGTSPLDVANPGAPYPRLRTIESRRAALDIYVEHFDQRAIDLASQLHSGGLSAESWQQAMREELKYLHVNALIIAHGGEAANITQAEWGRLGAHCRTQYGYLNRYAQAIQNSALNALAGNANFYSEKYLQWRSQLYGGNARASFYTGLAQGLLPQVPGDGKTICRTSCKCGLRFEEGDQPGLLLVYWELGEAEHCDDCVHLSETWNPYELWLPAAMSREWARWLPRVSIVL
jgi:hypothetical protein